MPFDAQKLLNRSEEKCSELRIVLRNIATKSMLCFALFAVCLALQ
jgi:hypothetical protein